MIKHRHLLEASFLKNGLTLKDNVQVLFSKPESHTRDKRAMSQLAVASFHATFTEPDFAQSSAILEGKIGPCPLARISDLPGYDEEFKPGASSRAGQTLEILIYINVLLLLKLFRFKRFSLGLGSV